MKELTRQPECLIYTRDHIFNCWELAHYFNWIFQCVEQVSRFALVFLRVKLFLSVEGKEREPMGSEERMSDLMQDDKASKLCPR